jgi:hypothetical protein
MASLLEVLHQNSISLRDPQTISHELDSIVRQSEDSGKMVREMEALLGSTISDWPEGEIAPIAGPVKDDSKPGGQSRQRVN